jgi:hypothetical protein
MRGQGLPEELVTEAISQPARPDSWVFHNSSRSLETDPRRGVVPGEIGPTEERLVRSARRSAAAASCNALYGFL